MQAQKKIEKDKKQINHFKKYIYGHLKQFEKCREWADINNWLHNMFKFLENKKFQELPNSILLAKRLAQCLTNTLPSGVHQYALKVYSLILSNFEDQEHIRPLMSIGLFPFFEVSSSQLKFQLLKIYENFFLNDDGCLQMTISLINALLTGLNQNNEELAKKIFSLCEKISKKYGYIWIDGAVWVNILKSSKVKIAGFKYFMKVFKDRDKQKSSKQQLKQQTQENAKQAQASRQRKNSIGKKSSINLKSRSNYLKDEQKQFLSRLYQQKNIQDGPHNRYPNFSTLVVNALRSCLQPEVDSLAKRAALQHVSTYLKLSQNSIVSQNDAFVLVSSMLRVLTSKQFSLTRRIYLYLFDQPNSQGQYIIDAEHRKFQLNILISSLKRMLKQDDQQFTSSRKLNVKSVQSTLSIIQILVQDHPKLGPIILPRLSYQILRFLKTHCFSSNNMIVRQLKKKIFQFNENVIIPYKMIFLQAILVKVQKKQQKQKIIQQEQEQFAYNKNIQKQFIEVIKILDFYIYTLYKAKYQQSSNNKGSVKKSTSSNEQENNFGNQAPDELKQICLTTIEKILSFLKVSKLKYEKLSYEALDFSNKINTQTLSKFKNFEFHQNVVQKIDELISYQPSTGIYARLITLHPSPKKQILLPYINQGAIAIVCIENLLPPQNSKHKVDLTKEQQKQIFYALFKLLQCHLWEQQAFQFVKIFIQKHQTTFKQQIDKVQASQWLIYWRLAQGDVKGGVIRMILSAQSENPLRKHMSCKWIEANEHIVSKIIEPIFNKLNLCLQSYQKVQYQHQLERDVQSIYNMIKIVFQASNQSFQRFFFLQRQKYLNPLLEMIFLNLEIGTQKLKTKSMDMMKYVLTKAETYDEKYIYISLTLNRILQIFRHLILKKIGDQDQNHIIEDRLFKMTRISSFDKSQTQTYLQEIQIIQFLANVNVSIKKSIKDKEFKIEPIIELFQKAGLYVEVIKGLFQSDLPYIRTLYLDFLKDSCDLLAKSQGAKDLLNVLVNLILDKLFLILKTQDITEIQETIRQKKQNNLKNSIHRTRRLSSHDMTEDQQAQKLLNSTKGDPSNSFYIAEQNISKNDMNIESKYAQIIQMWNSVKFFTKFSINKGIQNLPIVNLLSLILQSFPFSYLKYTQMLINSQVNQSEGAIGNYETLQEEINKITGLKKQVLEIIDIVWSKFNIQICQFLIQRGDPRILIHCTVDPIQVLSTLLKNSQIRQINKYYTKTIKLNLPKNFLHYSAELLMKQNQICYFLYLYLMYCNFGLIANKKLSTFLEKLLLTLRVLRLSDHIQIKIWLFQLIYLLSQRILLNKQIYIEGGSKIRQQLQEITKQILDDLLKCILKTRSFTYKTQIKTGLIANLFSKEFKQNYTFDFIKMNPPTIFVLSQNYAKRRNKRHYGIASTSTKNSKDKNDPSDQKVQIYNENELIESFLFEKWLGLDEQTYENYVAVCCIKTLSSICCPLIINIFQKDLIKVSYIIKDIILALLPICEDKSEQNQFRIELISELIYIILQNKSFKNQILPLTRRNIVAIFMGNDFFKTTKKSLYYWKQIIDACTEGDKNANNSHDLLGQLLARQAGLFEGLLKGKEQVLRQKIKSFQRICFVIYSGRIDKYENKLSTVLLFLNDVMKQQNSSPALLILMLFCIRILFMRLSQTSLNKMFKSIWPGLISILIQIFNSKQKKKNRNINLILAALKVVQLIHALEMQQFNFHKWIFITDFFGINIEPVPGELNFEQQKSEILTPFIFKPYMTNLLPQHTFKCDFLPKKPQNSRQTLRQQKQKRKIVIKQGNIDTIQELQNLAFILMQYMIQCNQKRIEVSKSEIQQIIEADFISLDDYIFEVK